MDSEQYNKGMAIRRAVLGDEYVDKALANSSAFNEPLQQMITRNCWGEVWSRDVLPAQTRSLITLATLVALRANEEIKVHVRGALRNGCSVAQIQEVLLHATVYCGIPAGIDAFRAAKEVLEQWQSNTEHSQPSA